MFHKAALSQRCQLVKTLSKAHPESLKSPSTPTMLQEKKTFGTSMDLNNWSVGNNSWFMQKARASLWKIKPEWLTQTDWNMDENHGNRLFSKQFMETHSETQHLGKESLVLISAYQHLQRPKFLRNRCVKPACPCLCLARREQPHKLSAVVVL